jgi:DNA-binding MarR family transcriptional regulator
MIRSTKKKASRAGDGLGESLEFLRLIWALDHQLQTASRRMEASLGVTGPQRFVLRIVSLRPGVSPGEVARTLHVHPSTLTGVLQRLEKRRLLIRRSDSDDARRAHLQLTEAGRQLAGRVQGTIEDAVRTTLAKQSRPRIEAARGLLEGLARVLEGQAAAARAVRA